MGDKTYQIYKDGNKWCATGGDFTDLQQSDAGFGDTPLIALHELIAIEDEEKSKIDLLAVPTCFERAEYQGRFFDNCKYFKECKGCRPICINNPIKQ